MNIRSLILASAALALVLGAPGGVHADQHAQAGKAAGASPYVEIEDESLMVDALGRDVDDLEDMDVIGASGEEVGEIDEVLMASDGKISAVSIEVGGFLGIGDKEVVVELDKLTLKDDKLVVDMTREQIEALPEWDD